MKNKIILSIMLLTTVSNKINFCDKVLFSIK
jgi:hypothetical protein